MVKINAFITKNIKIEQKHKQNPNLYVANDNKITKTAGTGDEKLYVSENRIRVAGDCS